MTAPRLAGLALIVGACATAKPRPPPAIDYPGTLVDPARIAPDFQARQHLTARYGSRTLELEAVLQKRGPTLTVVGLAPWGGKAFVVEESGGRVTLRQFVPHDVPFAPRDMLLDIDRAFFFDAFGAPMTDGTRELVRDGERVRERWADGHLVERTFTRVDGRPAGSIVVRCSDWTSAVPLPGKVELDNGWFHYRLEVETLSWQRL